jgi:hypothetical protein
MKSRKFEAIFWSIALPGFGQILNRQFLKGLLFIILEFLVNVQSNFNQAILLSFLGETREALEVVDTQWLMFYPCLYMFAMWDAYKVALEGKTAPYIFLPFVFCAYFVTIGLMYSSKVTIFGKFIGPIWLPILSLIPGLLVGFCVRYFMLKYASDSN